MRSSPSYDKTPVGVVRSNEGGFNNHLDPGVNRIPTIYNISNADSNDYKRRNVRLGGNKVNIRALKNIKPYFQDNSVVRKIKA